MGADPLTIAALGFSAFSAVSGISAAKQQAKAIAEEGAIAADNKKVETMRRAGAARASFLNSGFDMFGTPESSIGGIYDTGQSDIGRIITNANRQSKSTVSAVVTKAVSDIAQTAAGASGGFGGGTSSTNSMNSGWTFSSGQTQGTDIGSRMPWLT